MEESFIERNVDFKALYLNMMRAAEAAIRILEEAQRECEEMYVDATAPLLEALQASYGGAFDFPPDDA